MRCGFVADKNIYGFFSSRSVLSRCGSGMFCFCVAGFARSFCVLPWLLCLVIMSLEFSDIARDVSTIAVPQYTSLAGPIESTLGGLGIITPL